MSKAEKWRIVISVVSIVVFGTMALRSSSAFRLFCALVVVGNVVIIALLAVEPKRHHGDSTREAQPIQR